ncbi:hypothetical protein KAW43_00310 [Candidatus Parcubacteria bacterium]|nr:hypothetical protein [Candidatus Parcubacteria bacterium]
MIKEIGKFVFGGLKIGIVVFIVIGLAGWIIHLLLMGVGPLLGFIPGWQNQSLLIKVTVVLLILIAVGTVINLLYHRLRIEIDERDSMLMDWLKIVFSFKHIPENIDKSIPCSAEMGGVYLIGFVNKEYLEDPDLQNVPVFDPTSPNVTTGIGPMVPKERVKKLNITKVETMTYDVSAGFGSTYKAIKSINDSIEEYKRQKEKVLRIYNKDSRLIFFN